MDDQGNASGLGETFHMLDLAHLSLHGMEDEIDADSPTLTMALNEREILLICAGLPALEVFYPCLHEDSAHFQARLIELARAQQPDFEHFDYGSERPGEG